MMRFGISVKTIKNKFESTDFTESIKSVLSLIVDIGKDPSKYQDKYKSDAYLAYFMDENPKLDFHGYNPFYVLRFHDSLSIDLIYVILSECKDAMPELVPIIFRNPKDLTAEHTVCAFDLFDNTNETSFVKVRPHA